MFDTIQVDPTLIVWLTAVAGIIGPHLQAVFQGLTWPSWAKQLFSVGVAVVIGGAVIVVYTYSEKGGVWPAALHDWIVYLVVAYAAVQLFYKTLFTKTADAIEQNVSVGTSDTKQINQ